jgi:hypothetical protein
VTDVRAVNFIGSRGLNHRQLKAFLDEVETEYSDICTAVKFVGLAKVTTDLQRFLSSLDEIKIFVLKKSQPVILEIQVGYVI